MKYVLTHSILLTVILLLLACDKEDTSPLIPYARVEKFIDLNNVKYQRLKFDKGFVYEEGGVRGIIIYRKNANTYLVFERNCPFEPQNACAKVEVDGSSFFMIDPCCKSQFDFEGNPMGGVATRPLLTYRTAFSGNQLIISN